MDAASPSQSGDAATPSRVTRVRQWVARRCHDAAAAVLLLVLFLVLYGPLRLRLLGFVVLIDNLIPPLSVLAAATAIGFVLHPRLAPAAYRGLGWFLRARALAARGRRHRVGRVVVGLVALLLIGQVGARVVQDVQVKQARKREALGDWRGAAQVWKAAAGWPTLARWSSEMALSSALYKSGDYSEVIALLEPHSTARGMMTRGAYRNLWSSYLADGKPSRAKEVALMAMGVYPDLGRDSTRLLEQLERAEAGDGAARRRIRFHHRPSADAAGELWLTGNFDERGAANEITGYTRVPLTRRSDGSYTLEREIEIDSEFPYVAFVHSESERYTSRAQAMAQFRPLTAADRGVQEVELLALPDQGPYAAPVARRAGKDGRRRTLALWPDGGSWTLLNAYVERGLMPNVARLLSRGTRLQMRSTQPPFTATAYLHMVDLSAGTAQAPEHSAFATLLIQLKGIPFLDALIADDNVESLGAGSDSIFSILGQRGLSSANLVFNDRYLIAPNDLSATVSKGAGQANDDVKHAEGALGTADQERILREVLALDPSSARAVAVRDDAVFMLGVENTRAKADVGIDVWQESTPDFMLLRFPSVDIISHQHFDKVADNPVSGPMVEAYRHWDAELGRLVALLDEDDTLVLVSDHGILGMLEHHWACVLVIEGPGIDADRAIPTTIPIGHFPVVILSRFGIDVGADRLTEAETELLFGAHAGAPRSSAPL